jgi:cytochrome c peroxidase
VGKRLTCDGRVDRGRDQARVPLLSLSEVTNDGHYDAWLSGNAALSDQEMRGLATFNDPARGNSPSSQHAGAPMPRHHNGDAVPPIQKSTEVLSPRRAAPAGQTVAVMI